MGGDLEPRSVVHLAVPVLGRSPCLLFRGHQIARAEGGTTESGPDDRRVACPGKTLAVVVEVVGALVSRTCLIIHGHQYCTGA